jgi:hypothetical protein
MGVSIGPMASGADGRTTSATAFLEKLPANLTVLTDARVIKVLIEDKRAIGVEIVDGRNGMP